MRVAWLGPAPELHGGVPYVATQLLAGLAAEGVEVDAYVCTDASGVAADVARATGVRLIEQRTGWQWGRWYSRTSMGALVSGQLTRLRAERALVARLAAAHAQAPYDIVYQFSQFETLWLRGREHELPPVVVHPEVHAAGELRWHRLEHELSRRCEPVPRRLAVRAMLIVRSQLQRRGGGRPAAYIAPSHAFANHLAADYGIGRQRLHVVPNPIDLQRFAPPTIGSAGRAALSANPQPVSAHGGRPIELLFVSRLAVRKGVEMIVALSHRLRDEAGRVRLTVLGDKALFSNYTCLLSDLEPAIAHHDGYAEASRLSELYGAADALLVPSHYEPFALTAGEALACGLPVVASSAVGAAEGVDRGACRVFAAGDADAFEAAVRALIAEVRGGARARLGGLARSEAERLFALPVVARRVMDVLEQVRRQPAGARPAPLRGRSTTGG